MKLGTLEKLKFKTLKRKLKLNLWQAVGVLESLWLATYSNAPDGDIGRLTNEEIAAAIEWEDDADELIAALIEAKWLDRDAQFRLVIHDWSMHCANSHKGNYAKHGKHFADQLANLRDISPCESPCEAPRERPSEPPCECPRDRPTKPIQTNPNQTKPNQGRSAPLMSVPESCCEEHDALGSFNGYSVAFSMAWESYPAKRRSKKATSCQAWKDAVETLRPRFSGSLHQSEDWLLQRILTYAKSPKAKGRFCDGIKNWLVNGCYDDPPEAWQHDGDDTKADKPSMYAALDKPEDPEVSIAKRKTRCSDVGANGKHAAATP